METSSPLETGSVIAILAAGASTRMGTPKALLEWQGQPLIVHLAQVALQATKAEIAIITGAEYKQIHQAVAHLPVQPVYNAHWQGGIGYSVAAAARWANKRKAEGLLLMACDQPFVSVALLQTILQKAHLGSAPIISCVYANHAKGLPMWFEESFFDYLFNLKGDNNMRKVIGQFADLTATVPFPQGEIDLDTPQDYYKQLHP